MFSGRGGRKIYLLGEMSMNKEIVIRYEAALLEMCRVEKLMTDERDAEIDRINMEYVDLMEDHLLVNEAMDQIIKDFQERWGTTLTERDRRVAAAKKRFETIHNKALKKIGIKLISEEE
jgi:DNA-directed RNA polymerase sigma subunit (sigma70/sigma32)